MYVDRDGVFPYQVVLTTEFYIWQDAIDYIDTFSKELAVLGANSTWRLYLYSYDNTSYMYTEEGGSVTKTVITFPDNV